MLYNIIKQIERFIIINFFPLCFFGLSIILINMVGILFNILSICSLALGIILSFSYTKKLRLYNIAKYYIANRKSFENISCHYFDNPCSNIIIIYILFRYEGNSQFCAKYKTLKYQSTFSLAWHEN